jgi:molybdopterin-containing oxidoreductase family iron-sulfur binding subunit
MPKYGMTIDLDRCTGCRACMVACKIENNTSQTAFWMYVFRLEEGTFPDAKVSFLPRPCQHCDNAACVKVCPVGARYKRDDGIVATDWDRCIGCRYCEVACPYGVNYFNYKDPKKGQYMDWKDPDIQVATAGVVPGWSNPDLDNKFGSENRSLAGSNHIKGVMEKCTFCVQRVEKDMSPACVDTCPTHAIQFGDLDDPNSAPSIAAREKSGFKLLEDRNTQPRVTYLGSTFSPGAREIERPSVRE